MLLDYCEPSVITEWHEPEPSWAKTARAERAQGIQAERALAAALAAVRQARARAPLLSVSDRFRKQADKWGRETEHLSSPAQMMEHPSYQAILGLARDNETEVVRLMLRDLRENRRPWFWALSYLTRENPIKPSDAGKLDKMIRSWIEWGTQKGIL
jgi:hypothetical protein